MDNGNPGTPFLSACMIVKNEEDNIARCLASVKNIVDEIVIVDTGSTDRTMEIARSFGANIFEHPWENDFSLHRNQSIDHATGEWVFIIDADEEVVIAPPLTPEQAKNMLREFLNYIKAPECCGGVTLNDIQGGRVAMHFNTTRFFRRGAVYYEGIVHNTPKIPEGSQSVLCEFIGINHYGYDLTPEKREAKFVRTNTLLKKRLEINPNDYNAMFYLCQQNAEGGRNHEEAIYWGEKYIASKDAIVATGALNFNQSIYFTLFRTYLYSNKPDDAKRILQMGLNDVDGDLDLSLAVLEYGVYKKDADIILEGAKAFKEQFDEFTKNPTLKANRFVYSHSPEGMAYVLFHESLTHFSEGYKGLRAMMKMLERAPQAVRDGFIADFQKEASQFGMTIEKAPSNGRDNKPNYVEAEIIKEGKYGQTCSI